MDRIVREAVKRSFTLKRDKLQGACICVSMNRDLKGERHASSRSIKGTAEKVQMSLSHTTFLGSPITNCEEGRKEGRKAGDCNIHEGRSCGNNLPA